MLKMIQDMKFFLQMTYGDLKTFAGSSIEIKMQGLGQGNGASPAGWCVISIVILRVHSAKGSWCAVYCTDVPCTTQHVGNPLR
jgi:hypothetical protein